VLLLAAAAYVDVLGYQFVWDDEIMVVRSPHVRTLERLPALLLTDFTGLSGGEIGGHYYRPVVALSLALDVSLWGAHPAVLHLTNLLLHLLATLLVGRLALALGGARDLAVLASLVFALHPVHVEAVAFVSARGDLLLAIGALGCLLAWRRAGRPGPGRLAWTLLALAMYALAFLSKEAAISLPAALVLADLAAPGTPGPTWQARLGPALRRSLPFWALALAFVILRLPTLVHLAGPGLSPAALWARLPGALETLARYVALLLFPTHMRPFYALPRPASLLAPWPLLGIGVGLAAAGLAVGLRRRAPLGAFGIGLFLVTALPVLDLVPLSYRTMGLADRYLYLPSVGMALAFAHGIAALLGRSQARGARVARLAGWAALAIVLVAYPWWLVRYAGIWKDEVRLFSTMEALAPRAASPASNLGLAYLRAGDLTRAVAALERARRMDPGDAKPQAILAEIHALQGRMSEAAAILDRLARGPRLGRDYYIARTILHLRQKEPQAALGVLHDAARRFPAHPSLVYLGGQALEQLAREAEAAEAYREALRLNPDLYSAEERLGYLLAEARRPGEAMRHFVRSLELRPDRPGPVRGLALLAEHGGDLRQALELWRDVLQLAHDGATLREASGHIRRLEGALRRQSDPPAAQTSRVRREGTAQW
jgi:tetratricopeptide (TPR) repeat protein